MTSVSVLPRLSTLADQLNERERALCEALVSNPGIQLLDAGKKAGYSQRTAGPSVTRALKRPEVQAYLQALKAEIDNPGELKIRRKVMSARKVLLRLSEIANSSMKPHMEFDEAGQFRQVKIDKGAAGNLRRVKTRSIVSEDGPVILETEVQVADPMPALQALQKYHGLEKTAPVANVTNNSLTILGDSEEGRELLRRAKELLLKAGGQE